MLLSVIIPVYNVRDYLPLTLNALCAQGHDDFEIILIDDGSTDDSVTVAKAMIDQHQFRQARIISKTNGGVSSARNAGFSVASGEFVYFLDGDDYVSADFMQTILPRLHADDPDILFWGYDLVDEGKHTITRYPYLQDNSADLRMTGIDALMSIIREKSANMWTGSVIYRKDFVASISLKYTEGCVAGEDSEYIYKALAHANEVTYVDQVLSYYVQREGSATNSFNIKRFDSVLALERVAQYLSGMRRRELAQLADIIRQDRIVRNYTGTYRLSIEQLVQAGLSPAAAVRRIDRELEQTYPGLTIRLKAMMRRTRSASLKQNLQTLLFRISPLLHYFFGTFKRSR